MRARTPTNGTGPEELLFITRERQHDGTFKHDYYLSDADAETPLKELARVSRAAHRVEECFKRAKGEAGLGGILGRYHALRDHPVEHPVARHPRRYGAAMVLTGGLIGPPGTPRTYSGSLEGTPIFIGTSDPDPHVPFARVKETEEVLSRMGAAVEFRRYPGMPHTINEDELGACRSLLARLTAGSRA